MGLGTGIGIGLAQGGGAREKEGGLPFHTGVFSQAEVKLDCPARFDLGVPFVPLFWCSFVLRGGKGRGCGFLTCSGHVGYSACPWITLSGGNTVC